MVVVIVMIVNALATRPKDAGKTPVKTTPPAVSPSPTAPKLPPACKADQLGIILRSSQEGFNPAQPVLLNAEVTNNGDSACSVTPDAQTVQLHVVSGTDRIFDTADCAEQSPPPPGEPVIIEAGAMGIVPITWEGKRSKDGCGDISDRDQPKRGEFTYVATVKVNGADSDETRFKLVP
jgi:hypothetical protein